MLKKVLCVLFSILFSLILFSCDENDVSSQQDVLPKITQEYTEALGGKVFDADGSILTFYDDGTASYDYSDFHYDYKVEVTGCDEEHIYMLFHSYYKDGLNYNTDEVIDDNPETAVYNYAGNTLKYYKTYTCVSESEDSDDTNYAFCAQSGCELRAIPDSETEYCFEHTGFCENCDSFVNPGTQFCSRCHACEICGKGIIKSFGDRCFDCMPKSTSKKYEKCYVCDGTGIVKYYYGSSAIEAWLDGHEDSWYSKCWNCDGTGYEQ